LITKFIGATHCTFDTTGPKEVHGRCQRNELRYARKPRDNIASLKRKEANFKEQRTNWSKILQEQHSLHSFAVTKNQDLYLIKPNRNVKGKMFKFR
jgi:hypothetical protein